MERTPIHFLICALSLWGVSADVFAVPTPFLVKVSTTRQKSLSADPVVFAATRVRGGTAADGIFEDEEEDEEDWEEEEYEEEDSTVAEEEELEEEEEQDEDVFGDEAVEEEETFVETQEEEFEEEEAFEDALEDVPEEEPAPTAQVLEERMATTTDDENSYSSAFVDRMELADAYDEGETTAGGAEEDAAAAAATAAVTATVGGSDEDRSPEAPPAKDEPPQITEITDEMKAILRKELRYKARDVKVMRPDIAAMVVANRLRRPTEGMPRNWYVEGAQPSNALQDNVVKVSLAVVAAGAVALIGLKGEDLGIEFDALKKITSIFAALPKSIGKKKKTADTPAVVTPSVVQEVEATEVEEEEDHPQSVMPFTDKPPAYEKDLDKTWLDKVITSIENAVKAFFRIKI